MCYNCASGVFQYVKNWTTCLRERERERQRERDRERGWEIEKLSLLKFFVRIDEPKEDRQVYAKACSYLLLEMELMKPLVPKGPKTVVVNRWVIYAGLLRTVMLKLCRDNISAIKYTLKFVSRGVIMVTQWIHIFCTLQILSVQWCSIIAIISSNISMR